MDYRFSSQANPFNSVAEFLVKEYMKEHPNEMSQYEQKVDFIARHLLMEQNFKGNQLGNLSEVSIKPEIFPDEMKGWAVAKNIIGSSIKGLGKVNSITPYTLDNKDWSDIKIITRSKDGHRGAWFFSNAQRGSIVVKGQEDAPFQVLGSVFLKMMGFPCPDIKMVDRKSAEGQQLSALGNAHQLNERNPEHYLVMERVMGPSYANLSSSEEDLQMVINNQERLGELLAYDLVLGNFDRFELYDVGFNKGNIMFFNGTVCAIDTDCMPLGDDRYDFTKYALKKLSAGQGDYENKILNKLADNLGGGVSREKLSSKKIRDGINKGLQKIAMLSHNMEAAKSLFVSNCVERGCNLNQFPYHLEEMIKIVGNTYKGGL